VSEVPASSPGERAYLLLLAREVPDPPAHVLEAGAALARVAGGDDLDPRPVEVALVDALDHLLDEVVRGVEVHVRAAGAAAGGRRRPRVPAGGGRAAVEDRLQVPIDPLVARHRSTPPVLGSCRISEALTRRAGRSLGFLVWRGRAKESGVRGEGREWIKRGRGRKGGGEARTARHRTSVKEREGRAAGDQSPPHQSTRGGARAPVRASGPASQPPPRPLVTQWKVRRQFSRWRGSSARVMRTYVDALRHPGNPLCNHPCNGSSHPRRSQNRRGRAGSVKAPLARLGLLRRIGQGQTARRRRRRPPPCASASLSPPPCMHVVRWRHCVALGAV
jgi:hypothetical protein